jgi:ribosome-associated toxin RatA of RatAB toxin-antitoxin module
MAAYGECRAIEVGAPPERCYALMTDYERIPSWQGAVRSIRVLERDDQGRGAVLEYEIDAKVRTVRYRLRQVYDEPRRLGSEYLGGDFRDFAGEWRFLPAGDARTRVELDLRIDPGRFVPGRVRSMISDAVMKRALRDLKRKAESDGVPAA